MALAIDTSALLCRYLPDPRRRFVTDVMAPGSGDVMAPGSGDVMAPQRAWVVSALARTEVLLALHQAAGRPDRHRSLWDGVRSDWAGFWEVPLDSRCMARATEIGARYGLSVVDAVHLAAADRLPHPVEYLTLDRRQIPAAADLGFRVHSPVEGP